MSKSTVKKSPLRVVIGAESKSKEIGNSWKLYQAIRQGLDLQVHNNEKEVKVIFLDKKQNIVKTLDLSGSNPIDINDIKEVFEEAQELKNTSSVVVAQNTVDNNIFPKPEDTALMKQFKKSSETFNMLLKDYFIISRNGFFSFAANRFKK